MPFDWTVLQPVQVRVDTRYLLALGASLAAMPERTEAVMGPIVQHYGERIDEEVDANLSGRVLNVRSGEGRGSWVSGMTGPTTWEGENDVGYLALWERGFTAAPGHFPVRAQIVQGVDRNVHIPNLNQPGVPVGTFEKDQDGNWFVRATGKRIPIVWRGTKGGPRPARRWAGKALEAVEPEFLRAVRQGLVQVWIGLGRGGQV